MTIPTEKMRALTVWQPWAWLLAAGIKDYENRTWPMPREQQGHFIALHAATRRRSCADWPSNRRCRRWTSWPTAASSR